MISSKHRFIFLHVPKTGGNAVQDRLLGFSDDRRVVNRPDQDGVERYGVSGPVTPTKHATFADYAERLGSALSDYAVVFPIRPPFERLISLYYSPRWWTEREPEWDEQRFLDLLQETPSAVSFLNVRGQMKWPEHLLRFSSLQRDYGMMVQSLQIPAPLSLPRRNAGTVASSEIQKILRNKALRRHVEDLYSDDMEFLSAVRYEN
ncbi:MAG: sulfotransferase family 2 domain-containing protein [Oceanicaulis sp.]